MPVTTCREKQNSRMLPREYQTLMFRGRRYPVSSCSTTWRVPTRTSIQSINCLIIFMRSPGFSTHGYGAERHGKGEFGERFGRWTGGYHTIRCVVAGVAGAEKILLLLFPLHYLFQMGGDHREGN